MIAKRSFTELLVVGVAFALGVTLALRVAALGGMLIIAFAPIDLVSISSL
jgi:hypothetical protein